MTILKSEIKLLQSKQLSDFPSGGGNKTSNEVLDGLINNLFADISRLDRVIGRVSLREAFLSVETTNVDTYFGSHVILTSPATDPGISVSMFTTNPTGDLRPQAVDYIESYHTAGPLSGYVFQGPQVIGQSIVSVILQSALSVIQVGDVLNFSDEDGFGNVIQDQFVRVESIATNPVTFNLGGACGTFVRNVSTITLNEPLEFTASAPTFDCNVPDESTAFTRIKIAQVNATSKYYSLSALDTVIAPNDTVLKVEDVQVAVVPTSTINAPLVNIIPSIDISAHAEGSPTSVSGTGTGSAALGANTVYYGTGIKPGSLNLVVGDLILGDDANGSVVKLDAESYTVLSSNVNYLSGQIDFELSSSVTGTGITITAIPAQQTDSDYISNSVLIGLVNRTLNQSHTIFPLPAPLSVKVSVFINNEWVELTDNGLGILSTPAGPAIATGSINYLTGDALLTLGSLPDLNSRIIYEASNAGKFHNLISDASVISPSILYTAANTGLVPSTIALTWFTNNGGTAQAATDDGMGNLTGDATGTVEYATGKFVITPTNLPDFTSNLTLGYDHRTVVVDTFNPIVAGSDITLNLSNTNIDGRTLLVEITNTVTKSFDNGVAPISKLLSARDNGSVSLINNNVLTGMLGRDLISTVNLTTGVLIFDPNLTTFVPDSNANGSLAWDEYGNLNIESILPSSFNDTDLVTVSYTAGGGAVTIVGELIAASNLTLSLLPLYNDTLVPNTLRFNLAGVEYLQSANILYRDFNVTTNLGVIAGSVNTLNGVVDITNYEDDPALFSIDSIAAQRTNWDKLGSFPVRAAGDPIEISGVTISAINAETGSLILGVSDALGNFIGVDISGDLHAPSGLLQPLFAVEVLANSIIYSATATSSLSIDDTLIGVNTVRLPTSGKINWVLPTDVIVIHNTDTLIMPDPLSAGQVVNAGRTDLSLIELYDANNLFVTEDKYTVDLVTGDVTMATPLDLTGFVEPLTLLHRIEDMHLVSDVQVTGEITVTTPILRAYPLVGTFVSSALIFGDLQARQSLDFVQETWLGVFTDTVVGIPPSANYNFTNFPATLTNIGTETRRFVFEFTSTTEFNIHAEGLGIIGTGDVTTVTAPVNPLTLQPYFSLAQGGWSAGWSVGNVLRINFIGATGQMWINRTTQPGPLVQPTDNFVLQLRGDSTG